MLALASPHYAGHSLFAQSDETAKYAPSRDLESFQKLLPPPVEFIEGSSSGALAVPEGKYEPINATPKAGKTDRPRNASPGPSSPPKSSAAAPPRSSAKVAPLYTGVIDTTWPLSSKTTAANGLYNSGNTCFLNSALQCLLHTPPLLRVLLEHTDKQCRVNGFCMSCSLRKVASQAHLGDAAFTPSAISTKLQIIAKHMRRGRQEDSHEFLRYAIDALQKSCLAGLPAKIDPKLAETTWVHKIFGGRLRSRVKCKECDHNSDTFDSILDLSLDIYKMDGVTAALRKFVAVDYLKGADKYKCEKCKKPVNAEKRFSLHEAPIVLTVHLKRFTPMGRKIGNSVDYPDRLSLGPYMSEGVYGPSYSLYGVICHAGGGPNSGHYFAYVKSHGGKWCEMNDESVTSPVHTPVNLKNAYILFYLRDKGQGLDAAVHTTVGASLNPNGAQVNGRGGGGGGGVVAGMKKKRVREDDGEEDAGVKVTKPFIGPRMPSPLADEKKPVPPSAKADPQADLVRKKIEAASRKIPAMAGLDDYASDGSDGGEASKSNPNPKPKQVSSSLPPSSPMPPTTPSVAVSSPVSAAGFYGPPKLPRPNKSDYGGGGGYGGSGGGSGGGHKRKHSDSFAKQSPLGRNLNPYSNGRLTSGSSVMYGKQRKRPRPI